MGDSTLPKYQGWGAPHFWWSTTRSFGVTLLRPLSWIYQLGQIVYEKIYDLRFSCVRAPCPVISVGSPLIGGSGKTSVVLALAEALVKRGYEPVVITRGYGGRQHGPCQVSQKHTAKDVGDEAILLSQKVPTYVSPVRSLALALLKPRMTPRTVILLDDGHQHRSLHKDLHVVVLNEHQCVGNGEVFPIGPLREPLKKSLKRAQIILWLCNNKQGKLVELDRTEDGARVWPIRRRVTCDVGEGTPVVLFSGLGFNAQFLKTVTEEMKVLVIQHVCYPDHFRYTKKDEQYLLALSEQLGTPLLTTAKDFARLSPHFRRHVQVVEQTLELEKELIDVLLRSIDKKR